MGTIADKLKNVADVKSQIKEELYFKGYSAEQIGELLRDYPSLIRNLNVESIEEYPQWFKDSLVCWYNPSKQRLTNEQIIAENKVNGYFTLKDFSKNHLDMKAYGFQGGGMSGMDGYVTNFNNWTVGGNLQVITSRIAHFSEIMGSQGQLYNKNPDLVEKDSNIRFRVKGVDTNAYVRFIFFYSDGTADKIELKENKIYTIKAKLEPKKGEISYGFWGMANINQNTPCDITIEMLPLYEGGLCFDGVDDYCINKAMPAWDKNKGFTALWEREIDSSNFGKHTWGLHYGYVSYSPFELEGTYYQAIINNVYDARTSFTKEQVALNKSISYMTSKSYMGKYDLLVGNNPPNNKLYICGDGDGSYQKTVLWQTLIFNRDLTPDELDYVRYHIMGEELSQPIARYSAKGRNNTEPETMRNILPDLTGNGHHITLNNFAFGGMSGFGGYETNFNEWTKANLSSATIQNTDSYYKLEMKDSSSLFTPNSMRLTSNTSEFSMKFKLRTNNNDKICKLIIRNTDTQGNSVIEEIIPKINQDTVYNITIPNLPANYVSRWIYFHAPAETKSLEVWLLPEYPDALVFDGVDDFGVCYNMPASTLEKGFTWIAKIKWLMNPLLDKEHNHTLITKRGGGESIFLDFTYKGGHHVYSFGDVSFPPVKLEGVTYMTSTHYNGKRLRKGDKFGEGNIIEIGGRYYSEFSNSVFYELHIFDHDLTPQQIREYIRINIDSNYELPNN